MRRVLAATLFALASIAASAASPPSGGAPVTVTNTPLAVSLTEIPLDMDQRRPIDAQIVSHIAADLGQIRSQFVNLSCAVTVKDSGGDFVDCATNSPAFPGGPPILIRMVAFLPAPYKAYPGIDFPNVSCQAAFYLSVNNGPDFRVLDTTWSPSNLAPSYVELPVPIMIPPPAPSQGSTPAVVGKLRLRASNGDVEDAGNLDGCSVRVKVWATQQ
jgi:hypothetical protein